MTAYRETSTTNPGSKSSAEIEREVRQERAHVERTLDELQERLSPGQLIDQAANYLRGSGGADLMRNLGETVRRNPIPLALVGVGLAWMMLADRRNGRGADWDEDDELAYDADLYESGLDYEDELYGAGTTPYGGYGSTRGRRRIRGRLERSRQSDRGGRQGEGRRDARPGARPRRGGQSGSEPARRRGARAPGSRPRACGARRCGPRARPPLRPPRRQGLLHTLDRHPLAARRDRPRGRRGARRRAAAQRARGPAHGPGARPAEARGGKRRARAGQEGGSGRPGRLRRGARGGREGRGSRPSRSCGPARTRPPRRARSSSASARLRPAQRAARSQASSSEPTSGRARQAGPPPRRTLIRCGNVERTVGATRAATLPAPSTTLFVARGYSFLSTRDYSFLSPPGFDPGVQTGFRVKSGHDTNWRN